MMQSSPEVLLPAHTLHSTALVLDKTKLSEQDLIVTLLLESGEQVRAVARGARKPGSRLAARTELFCEVDVLVRGGKNLATICEAELMHPRTCLGYEVNQMSAAAAIGELARMISYENHTDPYVFAITSTALTCCEKTCDEGALLCLVAAYTFKVMAHLGWYPALEDCVLCEDAHPTIFSASLGGALCESCAKDVADMLEMGQAGLAWIGFFLRARFLEICTAKLTYADAYSMLRCAHLWAATHLDTRLKAFEFLLGSSSFDLKT